jgi:hypothetical protein
MAFDKNNNFAGGLTDSSIGQKASQTRIKSMQSPEWGKLRAELKAVNPNDKDTDKDILLIREILDRLDQTN